MVAGLAKEACYPLLPGDSEPPVPACGGAGAGEGTGSVSRAAR